jgi:AcrR family transcriptional regulator
VSQLSGVAGSTIFYHFKNKEELFLQILKGVKDDIRREFNRHLEKADYRNGLSMVEGAVRFYFELIGMMEERFLLLHRHYPYQLAERNPVCRGYLEDIYNCLVDIFEQAIIKGQEDGSIADVPARTSAFLILSMVDGLVRFKTNNLYNIGPLYEEVSKTCKRMLQSEQHERKTAADD